MIKIPNFYASPLKEIKTSPEGKKMTRQKDPRDIKVKDSLHDVARKNNKSFYSEKFKVNVDTEDGVLSNVPKTGNYPKL